MGRTVKIPELITIKEVAGKFKVARNTVHSYIKNRGLKCIKIGTSLRFHPDDVNEFINSNRESSQK